MKGNGNLKIEYDGTEGGITVSMYFDGDFVYNVFETIDEVDILIERLKTEKIKMIKNNEH